LKKSACNSLPPSPGRKSWTLNTSFVEQLNLNIRQRVAAVGCRLHTLCQGEEGLQHQLALFHVYHNFVLTHASLHQPLQVPESTKGGGSAKLWQPYTPTMAAGLADPGVDAARSTAVSGATMATTSSGVRRWRVQ
jgi:hypothetical protein